MIFSHIIRQIFANSFINSAKAVFDQNTRLKLLEEKRLRQLARFTPSKTKLNDLTIDFTDVTSYLHMKREIFDREIYKFAPSNDSPKIIDCGANIGLSTIYWKQKFPNSTITAFEPDPIVYKSLTQNIQRIESNNVQLINKAVWFEETTIGFTSDGADGGKIFNISDPEKLKVSTVNLNNLLKEPIDLLKIDIEGAENELLPSCASNLKNVKNLFLEYHSDTNQQQELSKILRIIENAGFRYYIEGENYIKHPLYRKDLEQSVFDLQVNIFAYRIY